MMHRDFVSQEGGQGARRRPRCPMLRGMGFKFCRVNATTWQVYEDAPGSVWIGLVSDVESDTSNGLEAQLCRAAGRILATNQDQKRAAAKRLIAANRNRIVTVSKDRSVPATGYLWSFSHNDQQAWAEAQLSARR